MINLKNFQVWFVTGSQHLYGPETLQKVADNATTIAKAFNEAYEIPLEVVFKPIVKTPDEIYQLCVAANSTSECVGIITWMHTFSPAKMWIRGLKTLQKPICHLHTQFNQEIPWSEIDMDFMNLNQSAHGDREFGFMATRMRLDRKVVVGHWTSMEVRSKVSTWMRAAAARADWQGAKFARFGDNMRQVAVTEGDKVAAEIQFGYSVNGYGIGDLVAFIDQVEERAVDLLIAEYEASYVLRESLRKAGSQHQSLREAARIELEIGRAHV